MYYQVVPSDHLEHHGVLGQKWGVRRYQNKDGSLTSAGKQHLKGKFFEEPVYYEGRLMPKSKAEKLKAKKEAKHKEPSEIDKNFSAFIDKIASKYPKPLKEYIEFNDHVDYYYNRYLLPVDLALTAVDVMNRLKK